MRRSRQAAAAQASAFSIRDRSPGQPIQSPPRSWGVRNAATNPPALGTIFLAPASCSMVNGSRLDAMSNRLILPLEWRWRALCDERTRRATHGYRLSSNVVGNSLTWCGEARRPGSHRELPILGARIATRSRGVGAVCPGSIRSPCSRAFSTKSEVAAFPWSRPPASPGHSATCPTPMSSKPPSTRQTAPALVRTSSDRARAGAGV